MKIKIVSPLLAILALFAFVPGLAIFPLAHAQSNLVYVSPATNAGDVGDFFDVFVVLEDVSQLVGYDITLSYDTAALDATSADFHQSASFEGMAHFHVVSDVNDAAGTVRTAATLLGCNGVDIFFGAPEAVMKVTFEVASNSDSALDLSVELAGLGAGCSVSSLSPSVSGGTFSVPPNVTFNPGIDAGTRAATTVAPGNRQRFLSRGDFDVNLLGYIQLDPLAGRAGFGGVRWTLVDPNGGVLQGDSNIVFMFPGDTATVSGAVGHSGVLGTHKVFVTVLRCAGPDPGSCVEGSSASGKFFKVHA